MAQAQKHPTKKTATAPKAAAPKATGTAAPKEPKGQAPGAKKAAKAAPAVAAVLKPTIALDAPAAAVTKFIESIRVRGAKLDKDIHSAACASLNHAEKHGDYTLLNKLILAMPKSSRRNALVLWSLKFGKFLLNDGKEHDGKTLPVADFIIIPDKAKGSTTKFDVQGGIAEPFWDVGRGAREGDTKFLYMDYIGNVMKKLANVAGDPNNPEAKKAKAAFDALTAVNEAFKAEAPPTAEEAAALATQWKEGDKERRASTHAAPTAKQ